MLETILPWAYVWPILAYSVVGTLLVLVPALLLMNVALGCLVLLLYVLLPETTIDHLLQTSLDLIREKFGRYFDPVEENLRATFPLHGAEHLEEHPTSLLLWHPHSLMSVTSVLHNCYGIQKDLKTKTVCLNLYHTLPVIKDIARFARTIPADYSAMKQTLEAGTSVSVMPGGIREMMDTEPNTLRIVLGKRRGVFRLALETGTPLVPVLTYGENELFPQERSSWMDTLNTFLYKWFRVAVPTTSSTAFQNWMNLYLHPLDPVPTYIGKPLVVEKKTSPTEEDIANLRTQYIEKLRQLFEETHPEGTKLIIQE